jgi:hypothetical protein
MIQSSLRPATRSLPLLVSMTSCIGDSPKVICSSCEPSVTGEVQMFETKVVSPVTAFLPSGRLCRYATRVAPGVARTG